MGREECGKPNNKVVPHIARNGLIITQRAKPGGVVIGSTWVYRITVCPHMKLQWLTMDNTRANSFTTWSSVWNVRTVIYSPPNQHRPESRRALVESKLPQLLAARSMLTRGSADWRYRQPKLTSLRMEFSADKKTSTDPIALLGEKGNCLSFLAKVKVNVWPVSKHPSFAGWYPQLECFYPHYYCWYPRFRLTAKKATIIWASFWSEAAHICSSILFKLFL